MIQKKQYDLGIVGGGLAGLSLAILHAKAGKSVILFEKNIYPFHRVCGEYISLEAWDFLITLGLPLHQMGLPIINTLEVSSPSGSALTAPLDLGGFGISRYKIDFELAQIAKKWGVVLLENSKVENIIKKENGFQIKVENDVFLSKMAVGSFGKRSNLDITWNRPFISKNRTNLNQYIGVKYHLKGDFEKKKIALHNFADGYCGISAIEDDKYCLCYLTTKQNLKKSDNSIEVLETNILSKNPFLKKIFQNSEKLWEKPEVISQISFEKKTLFEGEIPLCGDASGMIAPLCGNGMSMGMHEAYLLHNILMESKDIEKNYANQWQQNFGRRLQIGRAVQSLFGNTITTNIMINTLKFTPGILQWIIKNTHGQSIL